MYVYYETYISIRTCTMKLIDVCTYTIIPNEIYVCVRLTVLRYV